MRRIVVILLSCSLLFYEGCTTSYYKKSADKETYAVIREKGATIPNMDRHFTIEDTNIFSLELPVSTNVDETLGSDAESEREARILSLDAALEVAVHSSRVYQRTKEQLYLQALSLTLARHEYDPIFFGKGSAAYSVETEEAVAVIVDPITHLPTTAVSDNLVEQKRVAGNGSTGFDWLLKTGGRLSAAITTDFLRYLSGSPQTFTSSQVAANFVQPLWRGAGYTVAIENLTDSERNLLYAIRDFSRYRRTFSVQIATAYYGVLQNRDTVRNSYLGYQSFKKSAERTRALATEGRTKQAELARLEQQELSNQSTWISAIRTYKQALDSFKIQLGLSTDLNVILDDKELEDLKILHPDISSEEALKVALTTRLDLYNVRDKVEDSERRVKLAANGLKPQVDLVANAGLDSKPNTSGFFPAPEPNRYHWTAGLNVDLPLERKAERNVYRAALIDVRVAQGNLEQTTDEIKLEVRDGLRSLDQAKRNYEINEIAVKLGERRVEEQTLLSELGRGTAEATVSAQNDLVAAKNALTAALVGHTIARLQFWNNLGILYIKDNGQFEEVNRAID
ncbi:TolC family protein [Pedosphaera parvula]|uniref:Outer membrane protein-like protein n=1 Tax=Pedosphaera parvula (strain Ellin514) TaxID=320771 RepID=B9XCY5_PEDPL|nr:TolC family protein [Pedosphaera parvula]EEF62331.1 Outer membrane protein-like protein [Pedosphaera parvula Ellin514]